MQACNSLYDLKAKSGFDDTTSWRQALESLVMLVAPFAPHMSEQLWHDLGHEESVNKDNWPVWDDKFLASDTMTIAVQVNGKLRAEIEVPSDADQSAVLAAAKANQKVAGYLTCDPIKTIYVPGRLLSLVVRG